MVFPFCIPGITCPINRVISLRPRWFSLETKFDLDLDFLFYGSSMWINQLLIPVILVFRWNHRLKESLLLTCWIDFSFHKFPCITFSRCYYSFWVCRRLLWLFVLVFVTCYVQFPGACPLNCLTTAYLLFLSPTYACVCTKGTYRL